MKNDDLEFISKPIQERTDNELLKSLLLLQRGNSKRLKTILIYIAVSFWLAFFGAFLYLILSVSESS